MADRIQLRGDTAAAWTLANPVLAHRELAFETDTLKTKIGDGVTAWNALPYGGIVGPQGATGPQGPQGPAGTTTWAGITDKPTTFTPSNHGHNINAIDGLQAQLNSFAAKDTPTLTGVKEVRVQMSAYLIELLQGNLFTKTITGPIAFSVLGAPNAGTVASFILELTNGGSASITWWSGVKWASGTAPTLTAAGVDVLGFYTHDGGATWRGMLLSKDSK